MEDLNKLFSKLVRETNTNNTMYKTYCIDGIKCVLSNYLNNEIFHRNLYWYDLNIQMLGQSMVYLKVEYIEKYMGEKK